MYNYAEILTVRLNAVDTKKKTQTCHNDRHPLTEAQSNDNVWLLCGDVSSSTVHHKKT